MTMSAGWWGWNDDGTIVSSYGTCVTDGGDSDFDNVGWLVGPNARGDFNSVGGLMRVNARGGTIVSRYCSGDVMNASIFSWL